MRCNRDPYATTEVITINAGENVTMHVESKFDRESSSTVFGWYHPGPLFVYMGRMPDSAEGGVSKWDGAGKVVSYSSLPCLQFDQRKEKFLQIILSQWFKIYEEGPLPFAAGSADATWPPTRTSWPLLVLRFP